MTRPAPARRLSTPANGTAVLEAGDLWFAYDGKVPVLRGVDLSLDRGTVAMVLGRSGSGKTTLLKALKGLLAPQRGWVRIAAAEGPANGTGAAQRVAYVPQTLGLVRGMSALDNALTGALARTGTLLSLARVFPRATVGEARDTLASLGLADKMDEPVHNLSGGERQRVAIARALMQRPAVILADEFVSQLDPITAGEILEMMRRVAGAGVSFLVTTHETDVVAGYAERIIVMRQGTISHDGPAEGVSQEAMLELLR